MINFSIFTRCVCISHFLLGFVNGERLDLGGNWQLQNRNGTIKVNDVLVPGYVHTALLKARIIDDPYYRYNDEVYRWIDYDNWTFSRIFNVEDDFLKKNTILLRCEGLDTVADVFVNNILIGKSENMFQRYDWDVKKFLVPGSNEIIISFTSAITYAAQKNKLYSHTIPPNCPPPVQHGECHVNLIRKKQCSFSWDWGPAFASQGIWRNISINAFNSALINDVLVKTIKVNSSGAVWRLQVDVLLFCGSKESLSSLVALLPVFGLMSEVKARCSSFGLTQISLPSILLLERHDVKTWWPRGYGDQPLYNLVVTVKNTYSFEISTKTVRIGFREVELVQEQMSKGLSFSYKINNIMMFMKGANFIPPDVFEDRVTEDVLRNILQSSADANMNIVRNWGGGIYQHEAFYAIADELGLLVWQEFMFACDYYPADKKFLDSVQTEVKQQVWRLQYHPSILVWSGNNEIESSVTDNWYDVKNLTYYKKNYVQLFIDTIRTTVLSIDTSRPFISSSPSNGLETKKESWISSNPNSEFYGDVHYYNYTMDCLDIQGYPQPRFASEYGLQSLPRFQTLSNVTSTEDWSYFSPMMLHRQHHASGNKEMLHQMKMHFKIPSSSDHLKQFKDILYLSQACQAICIKTESEHYRRLRSVINKGRGHTMGAIYWQLNSIWPAPTWSSLEYGGKWKMLHYYVKDIFAPVIISPFELNNTLYVFAVSDLLQDVEIELSISVWAWKNNENPKKVIKIWKKVPSQSSLKIWQKGIMNILSSSDCKKRSLCVMTLSCSPANENNILEIPTNIFYFSSLADVTLVNPNILISNVSVISRKSNTFKIVVQSEAIAAFVWLDSGSIPGRFSNNGFLAIHQFTKVVFHCWKSSVLLSDVKKALTVSSLYDVYSN